MVDILPAVRFFDTVEAARYLSLGKSTLAKHRCYGTGPIYQKIGRRVLYCAEDLDAWAAATRRSSTSEGESLCSASKALSARRV